jgi:DNA-binding SARP family transcriptional activator
VPALSVARTADDVAATRAREGARLRLLDSFELTCAGCEVPLPLPAQRLLAFLALQDHPMLRGYVAGMLWLDSSEEHAAGSLRSALWRVRRLGASLVDTRGHRLALGASVTVDVRSAVAWAHRVLDGSAGLREDDLAEIWRPGELLPDWYEDWVAIERERLRALRAHALEAVCDRLRAAGRFGEASEAGLAAIRDEPLRESAHRALIAVHLAEGNRAAALHQYQVFTRLLREELGLQPSARMQQLVESVTAR